MGQTGKERGGGGVKRERQSKKGGRDGWINDGINGQMQPRKKRFFSGQTEKGLNF